MLGLLIIIGIGARLLLFMSYHIRWIRVSEASPMIERLRALRLRWNTARPQVGRCFRSTSKRPFWIPDSVILSVIYIFILLFWFLLVLILGDICISMVVMSFLLLFGGILSHLD